MLHDLHYAKYQKLSDIEKEPRGDYHLTRPRWAKPIWRNREIHSRSSCAFKAFPRDEPLPRPSETLAMGKIEGHRPCRDRRFHPPRLVLRDRKLPCGAGTRLLRSQKRPCRRGLVRFAGLLCRHDTLRALDRNLQYLQMGWQDPQGPQHGPASRYRIGRRFSQIPFGGWQPQF